MDNLFKGKRKVSVAEVLGLDPNNPDDQAYLEFRDLLRGLFRVMVDKGISKNELARRMRISRQAVYGRLAGKNVTMGWIERACMALGVEIKLVYVEKRKKAA